MARKRARKEDTSAPGSCEHPGTVSKLPNEILFEIWAELPPLERLSVSQTCRLWRHLALTTPRLWTRVAVVSGPNTSKPGKSSKSRRSERSIYNPRAGSNNLELLDELVKRSKQLPLDMAIVWRSNTDLPDSFGATLRPHIHRISRIHFSKGFNTGFISLFWRLGSLPALRTLTAGFNENDVVYADLPIHLSSDSDLPSLRQIHLGAHAQPYFIHWPKLVLSGVTELTIAPRVVNNLSFALASCKNVSRLTLVMTQFYAEGHGRYGNPSISWVVDTVAHVPELCVVDFPPAREALVRKMTDDARFRSVTLDYQGRLRPPPDADSFPLLPSPCDALDRDGQARLTLTLRDGLYQVAVVDGSQRRRELLVDRALCVVAPRLWDGFIKQLPLASAIVDALAWEYFSDGIPDDCAIPDLTIVILRNASELDAVSLAQVSGILKLRVEVLRPGFCFAHAAVQRLVRSRADAGTSLPTLSLSPNANFGDDELLCKLADTLDR